MVSQMKAVVTSIGEVTRDLCIWALERNGFEVGIYEGGSTLANKLEEIYNDYDEDFLRVDADVVVNRTLTPEMLNKLSYDDAWWIQFKCYGWFSQDLIWGGVQYVRREALPALRANIGQHKRSSRPETAMTRLPEFYGPRRFQSHPVVVGIHGFAARDVERVKQLKKLRNQYQNYDWELADKLLELAR